MTTLLIIDLETTGTDPETDRIIEVGAVLFDTATAVPVASKSALVRAESNPAALINGIPEAALGGAWCIAPEHVRPTIAGLAKLAPEPPIYVAHNASFERSFLPGVGDRWLCTWQDAVWPRVPNETGSLTTIALAYGVGLARAHRAIEDCLTLAAVLGRVHEVEGGLDAWLHRALEPKRELIAMVSYDDREQAKRAGFQWDAARRLWTRLIGESRAEAYVAALPFRVREESEAA